MCLCTACHDLDECSIFMALTVEDRSKVVLKNKLSYGCYGCKDHSARNWKQQRSCKICKEKHPTSLHGSKPKKEGVKRDSGNGDNKQITTSFTGARSLVCASTKLRSDVISICVVPVQIRHPDSNKVLDTYAMLDNCSQGTFVKEDIIEAWDITGAETRVTVKTLNGEVSQMTIVVENLDVAGSLGKPKWIKLPRAYTKQDLPVDEQEIATPGRVKKWNYLEGITNEICRSTDISVGLLIVPTVL